MPVLIEPGPSRVAVIEGKTRSIVMYETKGDDSPYYRQAVLLRTILKPIGSRDRIRSMVSCSDIFTDET
jgi:hypothetical protein